MSDRDEKQEPKSAKEITVSGDKKSNQEMVCHSGYKNRRKKLEK